MFQRYGNKIQHTSNVSNLCQPGQNCIKNRCSSITHLRMCIMKIGDIQGKSPNVEIHYSKYLKEHCVLCHWSQYKVTHSLSHNESWINMANTCFSCDQFGYPSRIMLVNKNEIIPFQKSPWIALCKNGILLKIPLFSKPNFKRIFQSSTTTASFQYSQ